MSSNTDEQSLKDEIARLERQLSTARSKAEFPSHLLLLLSDSALPLGSFAFSSGLESYLAHHPPSHNSQPSIFPHFLTLTLTSLATTTLPYLLAAYNAPSELQDLDATLDACTLCPVARRASVAQGTALLTLWERALRTAAGDSPPARALKDFSAAMKKPPSYSSNEDEVDVDVELSGHFAPVWAAVTSALGITLQESAYTFLFNHAKAVVSAAVRASVMGPYAAQGLLASGWLREEIEGVLARGWEMRVEEAGQGVPLCDLWVGRHDVLYSRIFNS